MTDRISCIYKECISHPLFFFQRKLRRALPSWLPWETRPPCPKVQLLHISFQKALIMHTRSPHPSTLVCPSALWQTPTRKMQLENGSFQLALAHTISRPALLNTHQNNAGGRKTQENPEAAASLVAVTVLMKTHPQRKSARQAIQRF